MSKVPNKSLYDILGVNKSNSCSEIKKAYLKLARTHHPDKGGDAEVFKEMVRASEILTDEKKRRLYDELGITDDKAHEHNNNFPTGFPFPFEVNLNDLFGNMFNNPPVGPQRNNIRKGRKPPPAIQQIPITLEQFYIGHSFDININRQSFCLHCDHTGAKVKEICKNCGGSGAINQMIQIGPMSVQTTGPCMDCQAKGERIIEKCIKCSGSGYLSDKRNLNVKIIPGTRSQETYIFPEVCSDQQAYERPGDVHIIITEDSNDVGFKNFKRVGTNSEHLETKININLSQSLIGGIIKIDHHPGFDEGLFIKIPQGSFQNDKYILSGYGMPLPGNIGKYGDLYIIINVTITDSDRVFFKKNVCDVLYPILHNPDNNASCSEDLINDDLYLSK
jgi:DnaJ family protein A protein 2